MSTNAELPHDDLSTAQQRRQANVLLIRLYWLLVVLLISAITWLYIEQQRFQNSMNERLQTNEQMVSRLNEMDDRLFSLSQQALPTPSTTGSNQAQNQLDLLRIQLQAADRLLADDNDSAVIELLEGLHWQLSQSDNQIAPALTVVIKQSLVQDIERLRAQSTQLSPWQVQNLAIQNIQDFLYSGQNNVSTEKAQNTKPINRQASKTANAVGNTSGTITRRQLVIHEVIMTLNLATQASNMRERDQLVNALRQARKQLQTLVPQNTVSQSQDKTKSPAKNDIKTSKTQMNLEAMAAPTTIQEVIDWLDQLIINVPVATPLTTTQVLNQS